MLATYTLPKPRFAVLLNAHAGGVTPRLTRSLQEVAPKDSVFLTESKEHARDVLEYIVKRDVQTVFAGGGDGTVVDVINTLSDLRERSTRLPWVGVLKLGTGNALAHWLGSGSPVHDLLQWSSGMMHRTLPVHMVHAEGTLFPFAGLGHDAAILNDYMALKQRAQGTWWSSLVHGLPGYLLAGYLKTVPNYIRRPPTRVVITNLGRTAFRIGDHGNEIGDPVPTGGVLYEGPASTIACATTPYYGRGLKMFPFATRRAGRFQLRVSNLTATQAAMNVRSIWNGTMRHASLSDYYVDRVRIRCDDAMPYQLGGDARGYRNEMIFSLSEQPVRLVGKA